jgi:DNA-binding response OmpR family regulator
MARIAIVDDEESLRETLTFALEKDGHSVLAFADGEQAWRGFGHERPDLMVLDIMMPRMDGLELCRRIRQVDERIPLIFLSSRDEEFDRILGLEIGGDDYLCKPFSLRELCTRVKVLLRRERNTRPENPPNQELPRSKEIEVHLKICSDSYRAWWKGDLLPLSISEFRILLDLTELPGAVRSREQLIQAAFPLDNYVSDRSIDSHIKRLRKKITQVDEGFDRIETVYGLGYRFRENL